MEEAKETASSVDTGRGAITVQRGGPVPAMFKDVDHFKGYLAVNYQKAIENYFNGDQREAMKFLSSVAHCVTKTPKLLECEPSTVINAFMTAAELRLLPRDSSGEAYIIPYKDKAQFQLGYQGIVTLLYRAGAKAIHSDVVFENDDFEYESGLTPKLEHKPKVFEARGKPIGAYAVATLSTGEKLFKVMSEEEIMRYKKFSKSAGSNFSPWNDSHDPDKWMWKKTVVKVLAKLLPKTDEVFTALQKDNEDSTISDTRMHLREEVQKIEAPTIESITKNKEKNGDNKKNPGFKPSKKEEKQILKQERQEEKERSAPEVAHNSSGNKT